jgi:hypothetical protein
VETVGSDEAGKAAADDEDGRVHSRDPMAGGKRGMFAPPAAAPQAARAA